MGTPHAVANARVPNPDHEDRLGVLRAKAAGLRLDLARAVTEAMSASGINQVQAARICGTDQPTISRVLGGRTDGVSLEQLLRWLAALGRTVEIHIAPTADGRGDLNSNASRHIHDLDSNQTKPIYLDSHSTTPVDPRVARAVYAAMIEHFGNANSVDHVFGEHAAELVMVARGHVAELVGARTEDVHFTSGATEGIRLALAHAAATTASTPLTVALAPIEHPALLRAIETAAARGEMRPIWLPVDEQARVSVDAASEAVACGAQLVCLMAANNEVGTVYPIEAVAERIRPFGARLLVDATQAAGHIPLDVGAWGVDYLVLSAHKLYGPKGVGALIADLSGSTSVGPHEATPNVPGITGLGEACRLRRLEMRRDQAHVGALRNRLQKLLCDALPGLQVNGAIESRLPNNLHISVCDIPNDAITARLRRTVALSTGAACVSGAFGPSHVLQAMGLSENAQDGALRIGLNRFTSAAEIETAAQFIIEAVRELRQEISRPLL